MGVTNPPPTARGDVVDVLHGTPIADPYRWLEDPDSLETRVWVQSQADHAEAWLSTVPQRAEIVEELTRIWDRPVHGAPAPHGSRWFQWRNTGLQAQSALYVGASPEDLPDLLLDPNALSEDGTLAVSAAEVSWDGALLAYALSDSGSDWQTWHVRDVGTGKDLPDVLEHAKFSNATWLPDGSAFYYSAPQAPAAGRELVDRAEPTRVLLHVLGTPQEQDEVVYDTPDEPEWFHEVTITDDGRWLVLTVSQGTASENQLHVRRLDDDQSPFLTLVPDMACTARVVDSVGDSFTVMTNHLAERSRVVRVDVREPERDAWTELIGEQESTLLEVLAVGNRLVCNRLRDGMSELWLHDRDGAVLGPLDVAPVTSVEVLTGEVDAPLLHWSTSSAIDPGTLWQHDTSTGRTRQLWSTPLALDLSDVVQEQVFVTSEDGTRIPVFLTHRRDAVPNGDVPCVLYGYGGFDIPITPSFSATWSLWVQRGGLLAVACLRGGGEYGTAWHDAGRLGSKENVFDDACAVAAWLASSGWSRPARIGLNGGSNGGLLVGACLTRHPELFGAFVPEVGVLDMLRFHLFTIGWAWKSDYGDPDVEADFRTLLGYSPLHNITARTLPPVLITTGDHDDRVVPAHSFKFAAALQHAVDSPVLLRVDIAAGHGAGKPTAKSVAERADVLAFLETTLKT